MKAFKNIIEICNLDVVISPSVNTFVSPNLLKKSLNLSNISVSSFISCNTSNQNNHEKLFGLFRLQMHHMTGSKTADHPMFMNSITALVAGIGSVLKQNKKH